MKLIDDPWIFRLRQVYVLTSNVMALDLSRVMDAEDSLFMSAINLQAKKTEKAPTLVYEEAPTSVTKAPTTKRARSTAASSQVSTKAPTTAETKKKTEKKTETTEKTVKKLSIMEEGIRDLRFIWGSEAAIPPDVMESLVTGKPIAMRAPKKKPEKKTETEAEKKTETRV